MVYNSNLEIEFVGRLHGQTCFTQLEYHAEAAVNESGISLAAVNYAYGTLWDSLKALVSAEFVLEEIRGRCRQTPTYLSDPDYVLFVNEPGEVESSAFPAWVTVVIRKVPNNTTKYPAECDDFRVGRASFSGLGEGDSDGGLLSAGALGDWEAFAQLLGEIELTLDLTAYTWTLGLERGEVTPDKVLVAGCTVRQNLGSQNTRKR